MRKPRVGLAVIAAILVILPIQLIIQRAGGSEPYPALYMPSFGGVPMEGEDVVVTRLSVVAQSSRGPVDVDPVELIPNETRLAESIAGQFFADEDAVREVANNGWLQGRLRDLGVDATRLEVRRERLFVDRDSRRTSRSEVLASYSVPVRSPA